MIYIPDKMAGFIFQGGRFFTPPCNCYKIMNKIKLPKSCPDYAQMPIYCPKSEAFSYIAIWE